MDQIERMSVADLAERVFGKNAPSFIDVAAGYFGPAVSGPSQPVDDIDFAEPPRPTAYREVCALHIISVVFLRATPDAASDSSKFPVLQSTINHTLFRRASPDITAPCAAGKKVLPGDAFGYFQGHGLDGGELSAEDARFVIRVLDHLPEASSKLICDDAKTVARFCGDRKTLLKGNWLSFTGADIKLCKSAPQYLCVIVNRTFASNELAGAEIETGASFVDAMDVAIRSVSVTSGSYLRE